METIALFGLSGVLASVFTSLHGWSQVAALLRETEQERIDREFFGLVSSIRMER